MWVKKIIQISYPSYFGREIATKDLIALFLKQLKMLDILPVMLIKHFFVLNVR
jgi:hypothetical protein